MVEVIVSPEWREDKESLRCFMPRRRALEFGDLETATWPEAEAVGGLNYSTVLELWFRLLVRSCQDCLLSTDPLLNSEFSTVSTLG
jgi:hypothetical protein